MARIAIDARKLGDFGIGTHVEVLLLGLAHEPGGHEYVVFVDERKLPRLPDGPFTAVPCRAGQYGLREHLELPWKARRHGAQLLHAPHYVLPLARRAASVVTIHDLIHLRFPEYLPSAAAGLYARAMLRSAWRRASCVVTVSEFSRVDLVAEFGERENLFVVPNGVSPCFFEELGEAEREAALEQLGLGAREHRRPFVLMPGNTKPHKNHAGLLRAFADLTREHDVELVLSGNKPEQYARLREQASSLAIAERIHWLGWLTAKQLSACYQACAVLALPSFYEGFGLPVAEGLVSGASVVAANRSSLPEVCAGAALLVDPEDDAALTAALAAILADPPETATRRARAVRAAARFKPELQSRATLAVYKRALTL